MGRIILTSHGLHTPLGYDLIDDQIPRKEREKGKILLISLPEYEIGGYLSVHCQLMGFKEENIAVFEEENAQEIKKRQYDFFYISEGNTFDMLQYIRDNELVELIREGVKNGACYIGASAGAHIAGIDVKAALPFDKNRIGMTDFTGLGLFEGVAFPHYDYFDQKRNAVLMEFEQSNKYGYVAIIGDEDVEVMEEPFQEAVKERAKALAEEEDEYRKAIQEISQEIADEEDKFQKALWETKYVPVLSVVPFKGKEYAVLLLNDEEDKEEIEIAYVEKDEEGYDELVKINDPLDKFAVERYVARMIGIGVLPMRVTWEVK